MISSLGVIWGRTTGHARGIVVGSHVSVGLAAADPHVVFGWLKVSVAGFYFPDLDCIGGMTSCRRFLIEIAGTCVPRKCS